MTTPITPIAAETFANFDPDPSRTEIDPNAPPWGVFSALATWIASVILILLMPVFFLLPYIFQQGVKADAIAEFATTDKTAIFLQILSIIPSHLITLAIAWAVATRFGKYPFFRSLGWQRDEKFTPWRSAGLALLLFLVGISLISAWGGPETQLDKVIRSSRPTAFLTALMATATAPLVEEIVYRGLLYSAVQRVLGARIGVIIVFSLFALVHVPQYWPNLGVILTICLLSLVLTLVRARTGKLFPCFVIHLIFNGVQAILIVLEPYIKGYLPESLQGTFVVPIITHIPVLFS